MEAESETGCPPDQAALELGRRLNQEVGFWACHHGLAGWLAELLARPFER